MRAVTERHTTTDGPGERILPVVIQLDLPSSGPSLIVRALGGYALLPAKCADHSIVSDERAPAVERRPNSQSETAELGCPEADALNFS